MKDGYRIVIQITEEEARQAFRRFHPAPNVVPIRRIIPEKLDDILKKVAEDLKEQYGVEV